ncbi:MAG: sodium/proton-translocating pyrophosphatase, partial [Clostridia bacterium]|nr:sodium/proton-translocating pyrophosphatase [Clostridia bacterium]
MEILIYAAPIAGILALLFALLKAAGINRRDPGSERMQGIARAIADGASAFLWSEYRILAVFVAVLFVCIGFGLGSWATALAFLCGALFSVLAGFIGMKVATRANVRTASAAQSGGMKGALSVAFSGGTVMGMCVTGLGLIGCAVFYILTKNTGVLTGFSLGASGVALFARVGGGIYTKAADVGADLVGKVETGIPEDDPRNPAVIADNVGDNVGDVAGMGADLFESYVGSIVSAIILGALGYAANGAIFPLLLAAVGVIASIVGTFFVRSGKKADPHAALKWGSYVSAL